ncbi:conserved hypothetical protein [delta proteobacterium NaphS2]|nr:conserved hypothetical protein [delta proteobacterium NaphS2]
MGKSAKKSGVNLSRLFMTRLMEGFFDAKLLDLKPQKPLPYKYFAAIYSGQECHMD